MDDPGDADEEYGFRFEYAPGTIRLGENAAGTLDEELGGRGIERALVVAGETVGRRAAVVDPVRAGAGDRIAGVAAVTTPDKRAETAHEVAARARAAEADALLALGGGSSLDVAKAATVLFARGAPDGAQSAAAGAELARTGTLAVPDGDLPPLVAVPTTLAGADLSVVAGLTTERDGETVHGGVSDPRLMPDLLVYDVGLFATTPRDVLAGSAMNGFDKAVETCYARLATPVTDATAERALSLLRESLPALGAGASESGADPELSTLRAAVTGVVLAQYGCSRVEGVTLSLLHAFGHALSRGAGLQQGVAHGVVAPAALSHLFEAVDARRDLLAAGLGVATGGRDPDAVGRAVVREVRAVRDALGLPVRLRAVDGVSREDLPALAERTREDGIVSNGPAGFEPTTEGLLDVLETVW